MPPLSKANQSTIRKRVDYIAKDEDEQIAAGVVMVPDKVDLQGDFIREDLLREWATQFSNFLEAGEADGGIMHAAWPSDWMELKRNEVLDEAEEIGGETVEAGAWVQAWKYNDDELWSLISDGVVGGHSIGAVDVTWSNPMYSDEVPDDVDRAEDYGDEQPVWELQAGLVREVSSVDYPAVPDAQILATKGAAAKRLGDHLGNRDDFIAEAMERGHTEDEAERMWDVLHRAIDVEGAGDPGKESAFTRLGKAVRDVLRLRDDPSASGRPGAKAAGRDDPDEQNDKDAAGGDTPADDDGGSKSADDTTNMSNDDPMADAPPWAKALDDRIDSLEAEKDGNEGSNDDPMADAPEWAQDLNERIDEVEAELTTEDKPEWAKALEQRVDDISKQTGATESQQLGGTEKGASGGDDKNSGYTLDPRKAGGN